MMIFNVFSLIFKENQAITFYRQTADEVGEDKSGDLKFSHVAQSADSRDDKETRYLLVGI